MRRSSSSDLQWPQRTKPLVEEIEMKKNLDESKHSMKMMWGCVAVIVLVAVLAATSSGAG